MRVADVVGTGNEEGADQRHLGQMHGREDGLQLSVNERIIKGAQLTMYVYMYDYIAVSTRTWRVAMTEVSM